jgi:X-X-X-Leu-X-X-Gly heptad repeat protein
MGRQMDLEGRVAELAQGLADLNKRVAELAQGLADLNKRLFAVEQDLAIIKATYATKADVLAAKNSVIMWVVSAVLFAQVLPLLLNKLGA